MVDIVRRLRAGARLDQHGQREVLLKAANEIDSLRTEVAALKYSLQLDEDLIGMIQKIIHILSIRPETSNG